MQRLVRKTSTILVALGGRARWYRTLDELPKPMRKQLQETISGPNAATVLIADENGRKEILKNIGSASPTLESKLIQSMLTRKSKFGHWLEVALVAGIGLCLYFLSAWK
jgi:hypothetical protein